MSEELPKAHNGCTCDCHRVLGITHIVACCFPENKELDTERMRACSYLLPDPGGEVVCQCLDEIERLRNTRPDSNDELSRIKKENYNLRLTLQSIATDCETQTSESVGMNRLASYARDALAGIDWVEETPDSKPYKYADICDAWLGTPAIGKIGVYDAFVMGFRVARELKE